MANKRMVKAAEDAVFTYLSEVGSSAGWGQLAEEWFKTNFKNDAVSGGPCEGASWAEYRKVVMAAMQLAARVGVERVAQWRAAPREVTISASNPRQSTGATTPGAIDVDVVVHIDDTVHMGKVTLAPRPSDGRLVALGGAIERCVSADLLETMRAMIGSAQMQQVLEQLEGEAIAVF